MFRGLDVGNRSPATKGDTVNDDRIEARAERTEGSAQEAWGDAKKKAGDARERGKDMVGDLEQEAKDRLNRDSEQKRTRSETNEQERAPQPGLTPAP
jgi:hypothetical protein